MQGQEEEDQAGKNKLSKEERTLSPGLELGMPAEPWHLRTKVEPNGPKTPEWAFAQPKTLDRLSISCEVPICHSTFPAQTPVWFIPDKV